MDFRIVLFSYLNSTFSIGYAAAAGKTAGLAIAIVLHSLYNLSILKPPFSTAVILVTLPATVSWPSRGSCTTAADVWRSAACAAQFARFSRSQDFWLCLL